jgi:membrane-associated phospholipid phosphatase
LTVNWRKLPERLVQRLAKREDTTSTGRLGRPRGGALGQIALIVGAWILYSLARSLSGDDVVAAVHRGRILMDWDQDLGFGFTLNFNHWITAHGLFAVPMTMEYASLHYLVTPLVLVWLWRYHPENYRPALFALLAMCAVGLVVYIGLPVAPPRLLPNSGWIDTMASWSHVGWWGTGGSAPAGFEHLTDQFAAMPSLHVGWAVWCAWAWRRSGGTVARMVGWIYPVSIAVTVVATANHYVLDVAAGVAIALLFCALMPRLLERRADRIDVEKAEADPVRGPGRSFGSALPALSRSLGFIPADLTDAQLIDLRGGPAHGELIDDESLGRARDASVVSRSD